MNILSSIKLIQNNIKTVSELINNRVTIKIKLLEHSLKTIITKFSLSPKYAPTMK